MAGKMSVAQKKAVSRRMKRYWAQRRLEKAHRESPQVKQQRKRFARATPKVVEHQASHRFTVRVIASRDQGDGHRISIHEHGVNSWGSLLDLLHDAYEGSFIEVTVRKG